MSNNPINGRFDAEHQPETKRGVKPRYDYDADEFYEAIFELAFQGRTNAEIADGLFEKINLTLAPSTFDNMLNGNYPNWTDEENARRGSRIKRILERSRRSINAIVRNRYLKMALGGYKTKNVTTVQRRMRIDGELTDNEDIQTTTSEIEYAPSMQAMSVWLHHHDPEWRKYEGTPAEDLDNDPMAVPKPDKGIDITQWIDQEVKARDMLTEKSHVEDSPMTGIDEGSINYGQEE